VSVRGVLVLSVNAIQASELGAQPGKGSQVRGGEPFSDLLESTAKLRRGDADARKNSSTRQEPTAPRPRSEVRSQSLASGGETHKSKVAGDAPAAGQGAQTAADTKPNAASADGTTEQSNQLAARNEISKAANGGPSITDMPVEPAVDADAQVTATQRKKAKWLRLTCL
jgi:hypothetical protein